MIIKKKDISSRSAAVLVAAALLLSCLFGCAVREDMPQDAEPFETVSGSDGAGRSDKTDPTDAAADSAAAESEQSEDTELETEAITEASAELSSGSDKAEEKTAGTVSETTAETSGEIIPITPLSASENSGTVHFSSLDDIPPYDGRIAVVLNGNIPDFAESDFTDRSFESYAELDSLGRCGVCFASVGKDLMPTEKRGSIGNVRPSGFRLDKYDFVDGKYLYNRCHLIGYQLSGENANTSNLITGTRYFNTAGMLPFENAAASYVKQTGDHVLYRVEPLFAGDELVARGVHMEAQSVEDRGALSFNVFVYNIQPGVEIDYSDGSNRLDGSPTSVTDRSADEIAASSLRDKSIRTYIDTIEDYDIPETEAVTLPETEEITIQPMIPIVITPAETEPPQRTVVLPVETVPPASETQPAVETQHPVQSSAYDFIINTNSGKIHRPDCSSVKNMKESNKQGSNLTIEQLLAQGYEACAVCLAEYVKAETPTPSRSADGYKFILNTKSKKIHLPDCSSARDTKEENKAYSNDSLDALHAAGYSDCGRCHPHE